jgi:hypothetical protein
MTLIVAGNVYFDKTVQKIGQHVDLTRMQMLGRLVPEVQNIWGVTVWPSGFGQQKGQLSWAKGP